MASSTRQMHAHLADRRRRNLAAGVEGGFALGGGMAALDSEAVHAAERNEAEACVHRDTCQQRLEGRAHILNRGSTKRLRVTGYLGLATKAQHRLGEIPNTDGCLRGP
jgi:hypothetical protein